LAAVPVAGRKALKSRPSSVSASAAFAVFGRKYSDDLPSSWSAFRFATLVCVFTLSGA
jgi:hypothetical protein